MDGGGHGPAERVLLVPWGEPRRPALEDARGQDVCPSRHQLSYHLARPVAAVLDAAGDVMRCSERGELGYPPATVAIGDGPPRRVLATAGPWIVHPALPGQDRGPMARLQVVLEAMAATSHSYGADPQWTLEGDYD